MKKVKFNDGWLFSNEEGTIKRQPVTLPHDAMQTEKRIPGLKNGETTGFYPGGKYFYEKELICSETDCTQTTLLEFEGVYQKSQIRLNGELLGGHIYGYTDFFVNLTGKLKPGSNRIEVMADNTQTPNSRWYSGSGIYRDVYLHTAGENYIKPQGLSITTTSYAPAKLKIETEAVCTSNIEIRVEVSYGGEVVARGCGTECELTIPNAKLWSSETPELYNVTVYLVRDSEILDVACERTGIRMISVSHDKGFMVNGETVKLRGGCIHHDNGPLGACSFFNAELRRARKMKEAGFNAIRYAHNPAGKAFLDACDEVGMYVMDEAFDMWECKKSDRDYGMYFPQEWEQDLTAMIKVARNHPSVVLYSIGNEILDIGLPTGTDWTRKLVECCRKNDHTRPVLNAFSPGLTCMAAKGIGINKSIAKPDDAVNPKEVNKDSAASGSKLINILMTMGPLIMKFIGGPKRMDKLASHSIELLDVSGYNYGLENYPVHMKNHPTSVLVGSETFNSKISEHWKYVEEHANMIGEFTWTAWDYLGETGIGLPRYKGMDKSFSAPYPCITGYCGCFDLIGDWDGEGAHVAAVWDQLKAPFIAVGPIEHYGEKVNMGRWRSIDAKPIWSWPGYEDKMAKVYVFAGKKAASVDLLVNGQSQGKKVMKENMAVWDTKYIPGVLEAVAYDAEGNVLEKSRLVSPGAATQLEVTALTPTLQAHEKDVAYIDIYITDDKGITKAHDDRLVTVSISGPAVLAAIGSGNPLPTESYTDNSFTTFNGHAIAIVRATGETGTIQVTVESEGIESKKTLIAAI